MLQKVHAYVIEASKQLNQNGNSIYISKLLDLSRNMVSQYLNQLYTDKKLVKINTRPVVFFDIMTIENEYQIHMTAFEYKSMEDFEKVLHPIIKLDFEKLIGHEESLAFLVNQCKATISYPPNGLPILLYGPTGSGKSYMAKLMYEYACNQKLIEKDKKFLTVNCSEYANNPELLTANLFGHKKGAFTGADQDNQGLIKLAEGGVLFLDEVHCLKAECQEKLFLFMDQGIYHMVGDNEKWYHSNLRLIFATTEKPEEVLLKTLLRRIPMIITIPSLEERGIHERQQLLYTAFEEEEQRIKKAIYISTLVYQKLLSYPFEGNIGELKNIVQTCCVHALFQTNAEENRLEIRSFNLPDKMMYEANTMKTVVEQKLISIHEMQKFVSKEKPIIILQDGLLKDYHSKKDITEFLNVGYDIIDEYKEQTLYQKTTLMQRQEFVQNIIVNMFDILSFRYGFKFLNNHVLAATAYIIDSLRNAMEVRNWNESYKQEVASMNKYLKKELSREFAIAEEIRDELNMNLDMEFNDVMLSVFTLSLKRLNHKKDLNKRIGIIISHGFSTASSISDAVNKFLGTYIFDAIDMPLHVSTQEITERLNRYLSKIGHYEELFLLVDMGSLEELYKGIENQNANIGIMNNVNTKMALEIGNAMMQGKKMREIFDDVKKESSCHYHIVEQRHKEKVILCSCASGMGTAERLRCILTDSLPNDLPIKVLTYDYHTLLEKKMQDAFFENYEVICIVGTLYPNIDGIRFVPIEDLIINDTLDELNVYFTQYLSEAEMLILKQNIVKNFSLTNIMSNLTILNPDKLLEHVADAIEQLQQKLHMQFSNRTCFGLYVHVCCLIERLVTRRSIEVYTDVIDFEQKELAFIKSVKSSFSVVEKYYSVEIPVEEIGYIFNYVQNN